MMAAPAPQEFFRLNRNTSEVKAEILRQFLPTWYRIQVGASSLKPTVIADLLAGLELQETQTEDGLWQLLSHYLPSASPESTLRLFLGASSKPELEVLKKQQVVLASEGEPDHPPLLLHEPETQQALIELLMQASPALLVSDPFASPQAQQLLLESFTAPAADLLLLLQPKKLRTAVTAKKTATTASAIFGSRWGNVQAFCHKEKHPQRQEAFLVSTLEEVLQQHGYLTLHFRADAPDKEQTSLLVLLATKTAEVYKACKVQLLPYSDYQQDGVPLFGANLKQLQQLSLFPEQLKFSVQKLAEDLSKKANLYNYKTIEKVAEDHHTGTPYIPENYRMAFEKLRDQGLVEILNPKTLQTVRKATLASPVKYKTRTS
ncbi:hypothetical protein ACMA1I_19530 [Pontibacter sp. 13R65]|uniref:hypothetical protein n=1 Tax=Pontibacter sp. 13R65 TaxID=3127458 RepID=UPI00301D20D9